MTLRFATLMDHHNSHMAQVVCPPSVIPDEARDVIGMSFFQHLAARGGVGM
jgi:hypothetical protein